MTSVQVAGLRGGFDVRSAVEHFRSLGGDAALLDPSKVCGKAHALSAAVHAERAFAEGRNRSRSLVTETILYAAFERQIGKALEKMRPADGAGAMVAVVFGVEGDLRLEGIGAVRDDSLCDASAEKAEALGIEMFDGVPPEDAALEQVAMVDLMKQRRTVGWTIQH